MPSTKVSVATAAAAFGELLVYTIQAMGGPVLPAPVEQAIVVLLIFAAGYFTPERRPAPSAVATLQEQGRAP